MAGSEYYGEDYEEDPEWEKFVRERQETRKKATSDLMALLNLVDYKFEGIGVKTEKGWICLRD